MARERFSRIQQALAIASLATAVAGFGISCADSSAKEDSGQTVKLGLFTRADDGFSDSGNISLVLLALRQINDAGGLEIDGQRYLLDLETAPFEDATAPTAAKTFDELIARDVKAVLGPPWSSQLLGSELDMDGVWRRALDTKTVLISESATSTEITDLADDNYIFRMMPSNNKQAQVAAQEVWSRGAETVAILRRDDSYGRGLASAFADEFRALGGSIVSEVGYDVDGTEIDDLEQHSYDAELDEIFAAGSDVVYLVSFDEIVRISQRIEQRGDVDEAPSSDVLFLGADGLYDQGILAPCSTVLLERLIGTTPGVDETSANTLAFVRMLEEEELGAPWNAAAQLYDAAYLIPLAMQAANSLEPEVFKEALAEVSRDDPGDTVVYLNDFSRARDALLAGQGVNYEGASGAIEFDSQGDPSSGAILIWSVLLDGTEVTLRTEKVLPY